MVDVWYLNTKNISPLDVTNALGLLPEEMMNEIKRFRNHEDRRLKLFGKMIVRKYQALLNGKFSWSNWLTTAEGKPLYKGGKEFNISHSGDFVAVAFSDEKVGIDIEKCAEFDIDAITDYLHVDEKKYIHASKNVSDAFFTVWTRKEAYLKARGIGIVQGLNNENCLQSCIETSETWFLTSLALIPNYKLALCSKMAQTNIEKRELNLTEF
ncbi:MAG: 4'-phosphopantetheinyl transferase [Crocinitomix sp.]|jgi:4'-phosphopantetheinyl transferase